MQEIEAKFASVNHDVLRGTLAAHGFTCTQPEQMMRRKIFLLDENRTGLYGRVRDEGNRITMTIKEITDDTIHGVREIDLVVDSFEKAVAFMEESGWKMKAYQETLRETWVSNELALEVVLDTWPGIPCFCEIEGDDENSVRRGAELLGFEWDQAFFGAVDVLYKHHLGIEHDVINNTPIITFENPPIV